MDRPAEDMIITRAREGYRAWEAVQASRPWYVRAWDRIRSECGYALYRLRKH